jgi:hypothetical protein
VRALGVAEGGWRWWELLDYLGASPAVDGVAVGSWAWWSAGDPLPPCCGDCITLHPLGACGGAPP